MILVISGSNAIISNANLVKINSSFVNWNNKGPKNTGRLPATLCTSWQESLVHRLHKLQVASIPRTLVSVLWQQKWTMKKWYTFSFIFHCVSVLLICIISHQMFPCFCCSTLFLLYLILAISDLSFCLLTLLIGHLRQMDLQIHQEQYHILMIFYWKRRNRMR